MAEDLGGPRAARAAMPGGASRRLAPLVCGALCTAGWVALMAGLFAGVDVEDAGLGYTIALLGLVVVTAASTLAVVSKAARVIAIVSAVLYAAVWTYLRFSFDYLMPDAALYALTAVFFLAPLVTGVTALVAGLRARR